MSEGKHHFRQPIADETADETQTIAVVEKPRVIRWRRWVGAGVAVVVLGGGTWWFMATAVYAQFPTTSVSAASTTPATSVAVTTSVAPVPRTQAVTIATDSDAERIFLDELAEAGVQLTREEQIVAIEIAREHAAHDHLIYMRERIRKDFRQRIPRLAEEQVEIAKVAVEHHFRAVTGREQ